MNKNIKKITAAMGCALAVSCASAMNTFAAVQPNPVISRNVPAYSSANPATASAANDEHYFSFWTGTSPDYIAYDLSTVPEKDRETVLAVWYNVSSYDSIGNYVSRNMEPTDYTIEINAADGGAYPENGWEIVDTVTDNTLSSRQHLVEMKGYNWIRMNITKSDEKENGQIQLNFDIHNVSDGVSDSWIFFGDSITAGGMNNCYGTGFATHLHNIDDRFFPAQENGGIGGITSTHGKENIDRWLSTYSGRFVSIAYGTNDAWGNQTGAEKYYENTKYMIDAVLAAGKVPVLPKIPYSLEKGVADYLPQYNAMVDKLWEEYGEKLIHGADLETFLKENPEYLGGDGVHPNSEGYEAIRKFWAETMYEAVYKTADKPEDKPVDKDIIYGDANLDGDVSVADAVLIMQSLANPDKFGTDGSNEDHLTNEGAKNADVSGNGDGVTGKDALAIQKYKLGLIEKLPE
ncbi:MAG: lysophospholipase [Ruminococcus sp.]|nr:lysophospholipase [Ruminococcus sp.]